MKVEDTPKPVDFDPNLSCKNPQNTQAAKDRGWKFDLRRNVYVDSEGCIVADRFGQSF